MKRSLIGIILSAISLLATKLAMNFGAIAMDLLIILGAISVYLGVMDLKEKKSKTLAVIAITLGAIAVILIVGIYIYAFREIFFTSWPN
jgi:protein-S-isoprenylcysteine O-methyltransferase Ste14